ncbi:hypothetical protein [Schlesneria sp. DSM 10557]|uniref:hypothetical protein n=1 Tax=Schlesneria sp. DSM 10557 TaxID=3044399 RepID=UPI00359F7C4C
MSKLTQKPAVDRLEAASDPKAKARVDREGGRYSSGVIYGVSLCSRGEALGHYMWIDDEMLTQIVDGTPVEPKLLKSRFMHPDLCTDGMGKALGTIENTKKVGDQVYGDLHFYQAAHSAPDGDLAGYVMTLAEEDPGNFGLSIVFMHDWEAEELFEAEHMQDIELKDDDGNVIETRKKFVSPDPLNVQHMRHARIAQLRAADVVDEPAANPNGLFHRENKVLADGTKLLEFVFGQSQEAPALSSSFGVEVAPERLKSFVTKFLAKAGMTLSKGADMTKKAALSEDEKKDEEKKEDKELGEEKKEDEESTSEDDKKDEEQASDEDDEDKASEDEDEDKSKTSKASKGGKPDATLQEYCKEFGNDSGAQYFMDGVSFKAAQSKHIASLNAQIKERDEKLAAIAKMGVDPAAFTAAPDPKRDKSNASPLATGDPSYDARAAFAAAIATPAQ